MTNAALYLHPDTIDTTGERIRAIHRRPRWTAGRRPAGKISMMSLTRAGTLGELSEEPVARS